MDIVKPNPMAATFGVFQACQENTNLSPTKDLIQQKNSNQQTSATFQSPQKVSVHFNNADIEEGTISSARNFIENANTPTIKTPNICGLNEDKFENKSATSSKLNASTLSLI